MSDDHKLIMSRSADFLRGKSCTLGIDEAGRGPVLGPMVYAVGICETTELGRLEVLKVKDSKQLTEETRCSIFEKLATDHSDVFGYGLKILSAAFISKAMLARVKYNLNDISHDAAIELIEVALKNDIVVEKVYVDTVGPAESYARKLSTRFPLLDIVVSKKADSLYPIVSAASICAKVTRDRQLRDDFKEIIDAGICVGSGYPSVPDPATVEYLQTSVDPVFGFNSFVRFSWSTAKELLRKKAVSVIWEDDEEESKPTGDIRTFFAGKDESKSRKRKYVFFEERSIESVTEF
ncbi:ribonuclease H2 subunit A [Trichuris trichiura]|uniref:Ribonuclease n=1 Tax=Trichuris trichiura TaxID=36087 RepID=A0A077ZLB2_TRITR|nr:ribonuclease H2 subunit A [Trichuris trichiura]